jgi:hypothetical protein
MAPGHLAEEVVSRGRQLRSASGKNILSHQGKDFLLNPLSPNKCEQSISKREQNRWLWDYFMTARLYITYAH